MLAESWGLTGRRRSAGRCGTLPGAGEDVEEVTGSPGMEATAGVRRRPYRNPDRHGTGSGTGTPGLLATTSAKC